MVNKLLAFNFDGDIQWNDRMSTCIMISSIMDWEVNVNVLFVLAFLVVFSTLIICLSF